jgi:ubiquitin-protein ligase
MPILSDDWSPYLTLLAVFDSLDNLLEEPDVSYSASLTLKN